MNKSKIIAAFNKAAKTYDEFAVLQSEVGEKLLSNINKSKICPVNILDAGCGTAKLMRKLNHIFPNAKIYGIDIAENIISYARYYVPAKNFKFICADIEQPPIATGTIDLIASNLVLHWVSSIGAALKQLNRILAPNGMLFFSVIGTDSLSELSNSWGKIDERKHAYDFLSYNHIEQILIDCHFQNIHGEKINHIRQFSSIEELLMEFKMMGGNYQPDNDRGLYGKAKFVQFKKAYELLRNENGKLPLTYKVYYFKAQKICKK